MFLKTAHARLRAPRLLVSLALLASLPLASAFPALASTPWDRPGEEVQSARQEVLALLLYRDLQPSPAQKTKLTPLLENAQRTIIRLEALHSQEDHALTQQLQQLGEQVRRSGLPADSHEQLARIRRQNDEAVELELQRLTTTLSGVFAQLTPEQRDVLNRFELTDALDLDDRQSQRLPKQLDRLRGMTAQRVERRLEQLETRAEQGGQSGDLRRVAELRQLVRDLQSISDADWVTERDQMVREIDPDIVQLMFRSSELESRPKGGTANRKSERHQQILIDLMTRESFMSALKSKR